jgi:hypothetical protein
MSDISAFLWFHGTLVFCLGAPIFAAEYIGPVPGAMVTLVAAALWCWRFRWPPREGEWYRMWVLFGYSFIAIELLACLSKAMWGRVL